MDGTSNGGEGGGSDALPQARCDYRDGCRRTGRTTVEKVVATLFFHKYVVGIVIVTVGQNEQ